MCLTFVWRLSDLGQTDFSPSSDEQMPPTDITQDMRVLDVYINEVSALMRQPHPWLQAHYYFIRIRKICILKSSLPSLFVESESPSRIKAGSSWSAAIPQDICFWGSSQSIVQSPEDIHQPGAVPISPFPFRACFLDPKSFWSALLLLSPVPEFLR